MCDPTEMTGPTFLCHVSSESLFSIFFSCSFMYLLSYCSNVCTPRAFWIARGYKWINLPLLLQSIRTNQRSICLRKNEEAKGWTLSQIHLHVNYFLFTSLNRCFNLEALLVARKRLSGSKWERGKAGFWAGNYWCLQPLREQRGWPCLLGKLLNLCVFSPL